jgi:hypothetical protein
MIGSSGAQVPDLGGNGQENENDHGDNAEGD